MDINVYTSTRPTIMTPKDMDSYTDKLSARYMWKCTNDLAYGQGPIRWNIQRDKENMKFVEWLTDITTPDITYIMLDFPRCKYQLKATRITLSTFHSLEAVYDMFELLSFVERENKYMRIVSDEFNFDLHKHFLTRCETTSDKIQDQIASVFAYKAQDEMDFWFTTNNFWVVGFSESNHTGPSNKTYDIGCIRTLESSTVFFVQAKTVNLADYKLYIVDQYGAIYELCNKLESSSRMIKPYESPYLFITTNELTKIIANKPAGLYLEP